MEDAILWGLNPDMSVSCRKWETSDGLAPFSHRV